MSAADTLLARLVGVKATGKGRWMARCPAHEDKTPSLSVREMEDGRVLIHDFAGCEVGRVLSALGLGLRDLYSTPLSQHAPPYRGGFTADELLGSIAYEAFVVESIAELLHEGPLTDLGFERLAKAVQRISKARELARRG